MPEVFNLNQRAAEVTREPFPFVWGPDDEEWELKSAYKLDVNLIAEAMSTGDLTIIRKAMQAGMGDEQWKRFTAIPLDLDAIKLLFNAWMDHTGDDPGESSGSGTSSKESTAGPSQRTSRATTGSGSTGRSSAAKKSGTARVNSSN